ncbi:hypothetical protein ACQP00_22140 [Dactylosporangium sp. CS-047395]
MAKSPWPAFDITVGSRAPIKRKTAIVINGPIPRPIVIPVSPGVSR